MLFFLKTCDLKIIMKLDDRVIQSYVIGEDLRNGGLLKDGLPWALGFASTAIDTLIRMNVKLVRKFFLSLPVYS